jgi:2'-5' RNA ligase
VTARPLRLFVAAYPPPEVAQQLIDQLSSFNPRNLRLTAPGQLHLTLQFIGDTDPRQLDDVRESISRAVSGIQPATVAVQSLISLPERGRARLIAAALEPHPTLLELHRRLAIRLAKNSKDRSKSHFLPHMTLGRYTTLGERIEAPLPGQRSFDVSEVVLVQSLLRSHGAEHRPLAAFPLQ